MARTILSTTGLGFVGNFLKDGTYQRQFIQIPSVTVSTSTGIPQLTQDFLKETILGSMQPSGDVLVASLDYFQEVLADWGETAKAYYVLQESDPTDCEVYTSDFTFPTVPIAT